MASLAVKMLPFLDPKRKLPFLFAFPLTFLSMAFSLKKVNGKCKQKKEVFGLDPKKSQHFLLPRIGTPSLIRYKEWKIGNNIVIAKHSMR